MTDPTTAIIEALGPMTRKRLLQAPEGDAPNTPAAAYRLVGLENALASGALCEVEWRETCGECLGHRPIEARPVVWRYRGPLRKKCPTCNGSGTVLVTLIATPEQAAIMDVLREGPKTETELVLAAIEGQALDTLLASNWITRVEQERECGTCRGKGNIGRPAIYPMPCPHCQDGKQTVTAYELASMTERQKQSVTEEER